MAIINTNLLSLTNQVNLGRSQSSLATAMERLSSGLRVNSAKDDAAGQAIGNRLTSQITGRAMAQRNANDGVSITQTAHGALDQINDKLQRIRELTVQGLNGTLLMRDSDAIQAEINQNLREIDRLAESVDYNGIPLLNGKAGMVDLQVGANDGQMLGLDLKPPGFSVDALGLTDFTVAGIEGDVSDRNTLMGRAREIDLYDATTAITMTLSGSAYSYQGLGGAERVLMQQPTADGPYGRYVSDLTGTSPDFYNVFAPTAHHYTETDNSTVQISGQRIYSTVSYLGGQFAADFIFIDNQGDPLEEGDQRLIRHDGEYLLEDSRDGIVSYYTAELAFTDGDGTLTVTQGAAVDADGLYSNDISSLQLSDESYELSDYDEVIFQLGDDVEPVSGTLVSAGGAYYLEVSDGEGGEIFRPIIGVEVVEENEEQRLEIRFSDSEAYTGPNLTSAATVDSLSSASLPDNDDIAFSPAQGDIFESNELRLVRRNAVAGQTASWMIEEKVSETEYRYHEAALDVELTSDGQISSLIAVAQGGSVEVFDLNEGNRVELVSGTSTVLIDPDNVTVNYTDANGVEHQDVLRRGGGGDYYFDLPESSSSYGNFKLASLVNHDGEDILIKTVNGNSEVIVYHRTNASSGINSAMVVDTDANGPDNDGISHTVINIIESDYEIRLKTPSNPLAALDHAIGYVDSKRSHLGAMENRLASVIESHQTANISLSAARSRILDADYAVEVAIMTKARILQQAGTSMLAQANQVPQNVLSLLD